jgi:Zn finger protein HypA/HybF involved in hydrogenase expression
MSNLRLKEVANEATNKDFFNSFFTASKVTMIIGYFGQLISSLTEFHFIFSATGGTYKPPFTLSNILPFVAASVAIYIFEVVGVRIYLVRIIRQIVNKEFSGNERKVLFVFNLIFVLVLCGSNILVSVLGQKYSFASKTNVTTTDKTYELSNEKAAKIESINTHFDGLQATLISNYDNDKTSIQSNFDADVKQLKNSQSKFKNLEWKYNEYTLKIDKKGEAKTAALNALLSQMNIDKEQIRSDRTTQINSITGTYDNRINDVSKVANSNIDLLLMVQKYTMPLLVIFIVLSWVAIVYNEIFLKGAGQTIEIKEVAKKPLLITVLIVGLYEKIYQMFYWIVAKVIGNKKYEFGDIQQHTIKYEIHQKTPTADKLQIAAKVRQIGYNRNKEDKQNGNDSINNSIEYTGVSNEVKSDNLTDSNAMNLNANVERYTVNVPIQQTDANDTINEHQKRCKNCNERFNYKHWNAKYCGEKCRIDNWELRTGKTFKKKAKK